MIYKISANMMESEKREFDCEKSKGNTYKTNFYFNLIAVKIGKGEVL